MKRTRKHHHLELHDVVSIRDEVTISWQPSPPITEVVQKVGSGGEQVEYLRGTAFERLLLRLVGYLEERADAAAADDDHFSDFLPRVRPPERHSGPWSMTPDLSKLVREAVEAYRRPDRQSRSPCTRAECLARLCGALDLRTKHLDVYLARARKKAGQNP
jgi:hypothetical protein